MTKGLTKDPSDGDVNKLVKLIHVSEDDMMFAIQVIFLGVLNQLILKLSKMKVLDGVELVGSSTQGSKILAADEFDFNICLKFPAVIKQVSCQRVKRRQGGRRGANLSGYATVCANCPSSLPAGLQLSPDACPSHITTDKFLTWWKEVVEDSVYTSIDASGGTLRLHRIETNGPACTVQFYVDNHLVKMIGVDLVPVLRTNSGQGQISVVPKAFPYKLVKSKDYTCWVTSRYCFWRVTASSEETRRLRDCIKRNDVLKQAVQVSKCLLQLKDVPMASYLINLVVLLEHEQLEKYSSVWQAVEHILSHLLKYTSCGYLPHFILTSSLRKDSEFNFLNQMSDSKQKSVYHSVHNILQDTTSAIHLARVLCKNQTPHWKTVSDQCNASNENRSDSQSWDSQEIMSVARITLLKGVVPCSRIINGHRTSLPHCMKENY